jgi:hypothetical protein
MTVSRKCELIYLKSFGIYMRLICAPQAYIGESKVLLRISRHNEEGLRKYGAVTVTMG